MWAAKDDDPESCRPTLLPAEPSTPQYSQATPGERRDDVAVGAPVSDVGGPDVAGSRADVVVDVGMASDAVALFALQRLEVA